MSNPKKLLENALRELHSRSDLNKDEQWFTRAQIGQHLKAPSRNLNPSRIGALDALVGTGVVEKRISAHGRWEFRLS